MSKYVVDAWNFQNAEQLMVALKEALDTAQSLDTKGGEGPSPAEVYLNKKRLTLVCETLTDGSHVMNLNFFD